MTTTSISYTGVFRALNSHEIDISVRPSSALPATLRYAAPWKNGRLGNAAPVARVHGGGSCNMIACPSDQICRHINLDLIFYQQSTGGKLSSTLGGEIFFVHFSAAVPYKKKYAIKKAMSDIRSSLSRRILVFFTLAY